MSCRVALVLCALTFAVPATSFAQESQSANVTPQTPTVAVAQESAVAVPVSLLAQLSQQDLNLEQVPLRMPAPRPIERRRMSGWTPVLLAVDGMTATMQGFDAHSTMKVLDHPNGVELNPLLKGLTANRPAFIAAKAGIAAGLIYATHHTAKRNKVAAVLTAVAVNSFYGYLAHRNYQQLRKANAR